MAPSKPAHAIVRYRKHTPCPEKGRFCTGYSKIYQAKWDENKEKCIMYQLPPEIILSIMECLDAPSMYMARQACSLIWSFCNDLSFKRFHYMLKDKKRNVIPGAPPGFKHDALAEHMSDIIKRLRPDGRCRDCHHLSFPEAFRLLGMSRNDDARQVVFRCNECSDALGMGEGEEPPTIYCDTQQAQNEWTVKIISKDEAAVGMFMASTASHGVHCKMCDFQYDWVLDEDRILLSAKRVIVRFPQHAEGCVCKLDVAS
ncbi:hypothetical protein CCHR01_03844 [Colletotrichum chrysophilum]|uniref:F-box domain-containing protein n=1 Tax=Colletotrichum chrysophilum TaxID=1836956 RepID=A0AAD9ATK8_9PEZI|nr:hypothetical protein CCHR01_03844 [Colletotrichum chrysophilum]